MSAATAKVLRDAADYIRANGWTRQATEYRGRVCAVGAILRAVQGDYNAEVRAMDALRITVSSPSIAEWNDAQKSRRPVLAAFEKAAVREEGRP